MVAKLVGLQLKFKILEKLTSGNQLTYTTLTIFVVGPSVNLLGSRRKDPSFPDEYNHVKLGVGGIGVC